MVWWSAWLMEHTGHSSYLGSADAQSESQNDVWSDYK